MPVKTFPCKVFHCALQKKKERGFSSYEKVYFVVLAGGSFEHFICLYLFKRTGGWDILLANRILSHRVVFWWFGRCGPLQLALSSWFCGFDFVCSCSTIGTICFIEFNRFVLWLFHFMISFVLGRCGPFLLATWNRRVWCSWDGTFTHSVTVSALISSHTAEKKMTNYSHFMLDRLESPEQAFLRWTLKEV